MAFGQWKRVLRRDRWNEPKGKNRSRVEKEGGGREEHPRRYSRSLRLRKSTENKDLNPEVGNRDRLLLFIEFHRLRSSKNRSKNHRDTRCKIANRVLNINLKNFHPQNCLRYIFIRGIKLLSLVAFSVIHSQKKIISIEVNSREEIRFPRKEGRCPKIVLKTTLRKGGKDSGIVSCRGNGDEPRRKGRARFHGLLMGVKPTLKPSCVSHRAN